jgi:hypothetical protein
MTKLFYLLCDHADDEGTALRESLCTLAESELRGLGAREITVFGCDSDVAAGQPIRRSDPPIRAMMSFEIDDANARHPIEALLFARVAEVAGYHVSESRPIDYARPIGRRATGMKQVTCIKKRDDLAHDEFIRIWHDDHYSVAVETQSTFGYVRNEILEPVTEQAPGFWSAIVEESFPIEALEDPLVFFGASSEVELNANRARMLESCQRFLNLQTIEVIFVSEYYLG